MTKKKKSMLESGIQDMIPEKNRFIGYRPFKTKRVENVYLILIYLHPVCKL